MCRLGGSGGGWVGDAAKYKSREAEAKRRADAQRI